MGKIYVVGIGPGDERFITPQARAAMECSDFIVGYTVYIELIRALFPSKQFMTTGMRMEKERCELCLRLALEGNTISLVCSGDAGVYGMASLMLELAANEPGIELEIVPGITAALSGAAVLGAPIGHDFCVISLSDLLTPWELIEKRLVYAAQADFSIVMYNPASHKRPKHLMKACDILLKYIEPCRPCGYVENIGRENEKYELCTLSELASRQVNMFTTVFIGNSGSRIINNRLITPRGYSIT